MLFPAADSVSVLSSPPPSIDPFLFYFLYSHHLTAFLGLTLLILGIASLLASDVVPCHRPKLVWNSFISELQLFFFGHLTRSHHTRCLCAVFGSFTVMKLRDAVRPGFCSWYLLSELLIFFKVFFYQILNSKSRNSPHQVTVSRVNLVGFLLSGQTDAGCNYQEYWALFSS